MKIRKMIVLCLVALFFMNGIQFAFHPYAMGDGEKIGLEESELESNPMGNGSVLNVTSNYTVSGDESYDIVNVMNQGKLIVPTDSNLNASQINLESGSIVEIKGGNIYLSTTEHAADVSLNGDCEYFNITNHSSLEIHGNDGYANDGNDGPYDYFIPVSMGGDGELNITCSKNCKIINSFINVTGGNGFDLPYNNYYSGSCSAWTQSKNLDGYVAAGGNSTFSVNVIGNDSFEVRNSSILSIAGDGGDATNGQDGHDREPNGPAKGGGYANGKKVSGMVGKGGNSLVYFGANNISLKESNLTLLAGNGGDAGRGGDGSYEAGGAGGGYSGGDANDPGGDVSRCVGCGGNSSFVSNINNSAEIYDSTIDIDAGDGGKAGKGGESAMGGGAGGGGYGGGGGRATGNGCDGGTITGNVGSGGSIYFIFYSTRIDIKSSILNITGGDGGDAGNGGDSPSYSEGGGGGGYGGGGGAGNSYYGDKIGGDTVVDGNISCGGHVSFSMNSSRFVSILNEFNVNAGNGGDGGEGGSVDSGYSAGAGGGGYGGAGGGESGAPRGGLCDVSGDIGNGGSTTFKIASDLPTISRNTVINVTVGEGGDGEDSPGGGSSGGEGEGRKTSDGDLTKVIPLSITILKHPLNNSEVCVRPSFDWIHLENSTTNGSLRDYILMVDDDPNFSSPKLEDELDSPSYISPEPFGFGTYYWKIESRYNSPINTSLGWSEESNFSVVSGADLYLDSSHIEFPPGSAVEAGKEMFINATVTNYGDTDVSDVEVKFYDEDPDKDNDQVLDNDVNPINSSSVNINSNSSSTASIRWTPMTTGDIPIYVWTDPNDNISEIEEDNNLAKKNIEVLMIDMNVNGSEISFDKNSPMNLTENVVIETNVYNQGDINASDIGIFFYNGDPDTDNDMIPDTSADEIGNLSVNVNVLSNETVNISWNPTVEGYHSIYCWVDPLNDSLEYNYSNNLDYSSEIFIDGSNARIINVTDIDVPINTQDDVDIYCNVTDNYMLNKTLLYYSYDGVEWTSQKMNKVSGNLTNASYKGNIPASGDECTVEYYIFSYDSANNTNQSTSYSFETDKPPEIDNVSHSPVFVNETAAVNVSAEIKDEDGVKNATLYYRNSSSSLWSSLDMQFNNSDVYYGVIPGQFNTTSVTYYIESNDTLGVSNETSQYSYQSDGIGPNFGKPTTDPADPNYTEDVNVSLKITDKYYNVTNGTIFYSMDGMDSWDSTEMDRSGDKWYVIINETCLNVPRVYYYIEASDSAGNYNTSEVFNYTIDIIPPIADAGINATIKERMELTFDGTGTYDNYGIYEYTWTFDDNGEVTLHGSKPSYVFEKVGNYTITLNVTDYSGNWDNDTIWINVTDDTTPPSADAGSDRTVSQFTTVNFDGTNSTDNVKIKNYTWTFEDEEIVELYGENPSYTFDNFGNFTVTLNVTDVNGEWNQDSIWINVLDAVDPEADAGSSSTIYKGTSIELDGSGTTDNNIIDNYTWNFNDDGRVKLYGVSPTYTFENAGDFRITLNVSDSQGNWDTDVVWVNVIVDSKKPNADSGPDRIVVEDETVTFDGSNSSDNRGIVNYTWVIEGEEYYGEVLDHIFEQPGNYVVELKVSDGAGNWDNDTSNISVQDITEPKAQAGEDQIIDVGEEITLSGSGSSDNGEIENYTWIQGDNVYEGMEITVSHSYPGTYQYLLNVSDQAGNYDLDIVNVTVEDNTNPDVIAKADKTTVYVGEEINFNGSESTDNVNIIKYQWNFGDGNSVFGRTVVYSYTSPGNYTVSLMVGDSSGNKGMDWINITVKEKGDEVKPTAKTGKDRTVKINEPIVFDGSNSSDNVGIESYIWIIEKVKYEGVKVNYSFSDVGTYDITLKVEDYAGNLDDDVVTIEVVEIIDNEPPIAEADTDDSVVFVGESVIFDGTGSYDDREIVEYSWDFGDGETASGDIVKHTFSETGDYRISLTVYDGSGNMDTDTLSITTVEKEGNETEEIDTDGDGVPDKEDSDDDGDGMPDDWEKKYDLDPKDPSDSSEDPDDDGKDNLKEYKDGTSPISAPKNDDTLEGRDDFTLWILFIVLGIIGVALVIVYIHTNSSEYEKEESGEDRGLNENEFDDMG